MNVRIHEWFITRRDQAYRDVFYTSQEARIVINQWLQQYNTCRPHCALGTSLQPQKRVSAPLIESVLRNQHFLRSTFPASPANLLKVYMALNAVDNNTGCEMLAFEIFERVR